MSGNSIAHIGDALPISLLIEDGATGQYPQAEVRDSVGILLTTINLLHVAGGLYLPAAIYVMPDESSVSVTYIVYGDASYAVESTIYLRDCDIFNTDDRRLDDLYKLQGLDIGNTMSVRPESRKVGHIVLEISGNGRTITEVKRTA